MTDEELNAELLAHAQGQSPPAVRVCVECGCDDDHACEPFGCAWAGILAGGNGGPVCTACAPAGTILEGRNAGVHLEPMS